MPGGKWREGTVGVGVELDEDVVPDLDAARLAGVDERAPRGLVVGGQEVEVDLRARAARPGVAHHPEIVLPAAGEDVDLGIKAGLFEDVLPDVVDLLVQLGRIAPGLVGLIDGGEESLRRNAPDLGDQLPAPFERLLLEVVTEGPVAEHLEEGVMVGVEADVLEIVVLAAGADAFLRVGGAGVAAGLYAGPLGNVGLPVAEEDRHELVHAGVGEEQAGRIRQQRRRRHDRVAVFLEKIEEALADVSGGHEQL